MISSTVLFVQVHLQQYADTIYSAGEPRGYSDDNPQPSTSRSEDPQSTVEDDTVADFNTSMAELEIVTKDRNEAETNGSKTDISEPEAEGHSNGQVAEEKSPDKGEDSSSAEVSSGGDNSIRVTESKDREDNSQTAENSDRGDKPQTAENVESSDRHTTEESKSDSDSEEDNALVDTARVVEDFEINSLKM